MKNTEIIKVEEWSFERATQLASFPLHHGVTRRMGGVSQEPCESFNLALHVGDEEEAVLANRQQVADYLHVEATKITCANQVHGLQVRYVGLDEVGAGAFSQQTALADCDAMYTDVIGVPLFLFVADCVPVLLYDAQKKIVAVVHAGWRGAIGHLPIITMQAMKEQFGCKAEDMYAFLGPSIGPESFEVSNDLAVQFEQEARRLGFTNPIVRYEPTPHVDLWHFIEQDLQRHGVPLDHITITDSDSMVDETCFSYRREKGATGRMALFAML